MPKYKNTFYMSIWWRYIIMIIYDFDNIFYDLKPLVAITNIYKA